MTITMVDTTAAVEGRTYLSGEPGPACEACPYRKPCLSISPGRPLRVVAVRSITHPCALTNGQVQVVEVEPAELAVSLVAGPGTVAGATIALGGPQAQCKRFTCPHYRLCHPPVKGKAEIISLGEKLVCLEGHTVHTAEVRPSDD